MKKYILTLMLAIASMGAVASEKADTIKVVNSLISRVIEDETISSKGNKVKKYYFVYNGELIATSKSVIEKYNLCRKYNANLAMVIIKKGNNKRIILNLGEYQRLLGIL